MILGGKYELDRRLGSGGMAEVYLARLVGKDGFTRPVAIKRVLAHLASDEAFVTMFVAEAQMCARLQHPNIVSVLDFDRDDDGRPFLVIELVDGPSLADLATTPLPTDAAIHVATEILRGLAYAHDLPGGDDGVRGIVHRDISPHNVLLSWEGAIKVSDFGIAKARAASGVTASELLKGKPAYMSPEQANGEALDGRSDLFAVGIVLWELLAGRSLFSGSTTQETLARVLFAPIPSPRSIRADIPDDLDAVVTKLLARDRSDRYANAATAIDALIACKDSPRDGRGRLVALLADRFASDSPHRRRLLEEAPTVRTPNVQPNVALPSPRDVGKLDERGRTQSRTRVLLLALGAIAVASVAVATTVIALERRDRSPQAESPVVSRVDDVESSVVDSSVVDSGVVLVDSSIAVEHPVVDASTVVDRHDATITARRGVDARVQHAAVAPDATSKPEPHDVAPDTAIKPEPHDAAPDHAGDDPQASARAAARKEFMELEKRNLFVNYPLPSKIKPEEVFTRMRREAERLFGNVEEGAIAWYAIRPDGTLDTMESASWMTFSAAHPEDESAKCLVVMLHGDTARTHLEKQACGLGSRRPRCTARQLHQRAVARGLPQTEMIGAVLDKEGKWEVYRKERREFSIPNDCNP